MRLWNKIGGIAASVAGLMSGTAVLAQGLEIVGQPTNGSTGFQPAATELARDQQGLDWIILVIIAVITIFVTSLLIWVIIRYNKKRNPTPATFTHNSPLEVMWTVVPILILVFIGAFSLPVLFKQQEIPVGDITIKVTGYQWYWGYEYVDDGINSPNAEGATPVAFESYMIGAPATGGDNRLSPEVSEQLAAAGYTDREFLLATDTAVVVPVGKTVVMQVTGADVIHSWTIPAFGVKQDAVPGRLAQLWFNAEREGIYFGQCSELCGIAHAYMPITVKVVSEEVYAQWLAAAQAGDVVLSAADVEAYSAVTLAANN
ncbi:MAG: cytochrome c oxidase subunit II [Paracoccaceae bacterium]